MVTIKYSKAVEARLREIDITLNSIYTEERPRSDYFEDMPDLMGLIDRLNYEELQYLRGDATEVMTRKPVEWEVV